MTKVNEYASQFENVDLHPGSPSAKIYELIKNGDFSQFEFVGRGDFSDVYDFQLGDGTYVVVKITKDRSLREGLTNQNINDIMLKMLLGGGGRAPIADNSLETAVNVQTVMTQYNEGKYRFPQPERLQKINFAKILDYFDDGKSQVEIMESIEFLDTNLTLLVCVCLAELNKSGVVIKQISEPKLMENIQKKLEGYGKIPNARRLLNTVRGLLKLNTDGQNHFNFVRNAYINFKDKFPVLLVDIGHSDIDKLLLDDLQQDNTYPVFSTNDKGETIVSFWVSDLIPIENRIVPLSSNKIDQYNISK